MHRLVTTNDRKNCTDITHKKAACRDRGIEHDTNWKTSLKCSICEVHMHDGKCFQRYHFPIFNKPLETPFIDANLNIVHLL